MPLLLAEIARRSTSPLNRSECARQLDYASRQSFDLRLARLTQAFAVVWCHQVNQEGKRVAGAQSKLYLADPLLAWLGPALRSGLRSPDMSQLTEAALAVALAGAIDNRQPGRWMTDDAIGYLRTGKGKEIDLAPVPVPTPSGEAMTTPLESKWVTRGWRSEAQTLEQKLGRGVVATKSILDLSHPAWAIPAPIVSLLLG